MDKKSFIRLMVCCIFYAATFSTSSALAAPKTFKYTYDALGRLIVVDDTTNGKRTFTYDKAGNRTTVTVAPAPLSSSPAAP
jgi:YD repeat-containing protein